jgi:lipopolysaccharide export system protein LptA
MDVTNGFTLATSTGGHLAAPKGSMDFDEHNQPRHGHLEGGVRMDSVSGNRQIHGTSPAAELEFSKLGELSLAHLERGVEIHGEEVSETVENSGASTERLSRTWKSPLADIAFRDAGHGKVEPASMHGAGGVVITGESQRGKAAPVPSRLAADELTGDFGPNSTLTAMTGVGHAGMEETTAAGAWETATGDRLAASFSGPGAAKAGTGGAAQIQSAVLDGHVALVEQPAAKPGAPMEPPMRATAGHAVYEGAGQWLHLTMNPRAEDGAMQLTADKLDVSQESGDAFARGNVKATWLDNGKSDNARASVGTAGESMTLGGQGPAHAIAQEAQLDRGRDKVTFGGHARLWQQANSIAGPAIAIDRRAKTLVARSADRAEPVRVAMLSAGGPEAGSGASPVAGKESAVSLGSGSGGISVIRVRGGELDYSDIERKAVMSGGALGPVVAETGTATVVSSQVELYLLPAGKGAAREAGQGQVDRMTASGHVVVTSPSRRGTGEQLTYASRTGEYVLTGTAAAPPRITDVARGNVTGEALIFRSRDDSVSIEGGGRETRTETTVRQGQGRSEQHK